MNDEQLFVQLGFVIRDSVCECFFFHFSLIFSGDLLVNISDSKQAKNKSKLRDVLSSGNNLTCTFHTSDVSNSLASRVPDDTDQVHQQQQHQHHEQHNQFLSILNKSFSHNKSPGAKKWNESENTGTVEKRVLNQPAAEPIGGKGITKSSVICPQKKNSSRSFFLKRQHSLSDVWQTSLKSTTAMSQATAKMDDTELVNSTIRSEVTCPNHNISGTAIGTTNIQSGGDGVAAAASEPIGATGAGAINIGGTTIPIAPKKPTRRAGVKPQPDRPMRALFCLTRTNPLRKLCIAIVEWK